MNDKTLVIIGVTAILAFAGIMGGLVYKQVQQCPSKLELVEGQLKNCETSTEFLVKNCECVK
jgi:hypothetical protein